MRLPSFPGCHYSRRHSGGPMAEDVEEGRNNCWEQIDVLVDGNAISTDFSAPANTVDRLAWPGNTLRSTARTMLRVFTHTVIFNNSSIDGGSIAARIFSPKIGKYGAISRISSKNISPYGGTFSGLTKIWSVSWGFTTAKIKCQFTLGSLPTSKFRCAHIWTRQYASLFSARLTMP